MTLQTGREVGLIVQVEEPVSVETLSFALIETPSNEAGSKHTTTLATKQALQNKSMVVPDGFHLHA